MIRLRKVLGFGRSVHVSRLPTFTEVEGPAIAATTPRSTIALVVPPGTSRYQRMSAGITTTKPEQRPPTRNERTLYQRRTAQLPRARRDH